MSRLFLCGGGRRNHMWWVAVAVAVGQTGAGGRREPSAGIKHLRRHVARSSAPQTRCHHRHVATSPARWHVPQLRRPLRCVAIVPMIVHRASGWTHPIPSHPSPLFG
jgi:hypothetical protein